MSRWLLWLLLTPFVLQAQLQAYKKGLSSFEKGFYDVAINELLKVQEIDPSQELNLNFTIAEAYRLTNRWTSAVPYYQKALDLGASNKEILFHLAYGQKAGGQYEEALSNFKKYIEGGTTNATYNEWANREINTLQIVPILENKISDKQFRNLKEINTEGAEFSPIVYGNKLVFSSSRKEKLYSNGLPFLGIYSCPLANESGSFGEVSKFSEAIFDSERNEGSPAFSPDGKMVIFARSNSGKRKDLSPDVDLYLSRYVSSSGWTEPQLVSASDSASWDGCPAFSGDGRTIYFGSNRPGGSGGIDLYRVNMDASGRFGNPVNMGKVINTPGNEMFPFVTSDGKLYFSSDGHPSLGKLDLFVAERVRGKITVENMGVPFNSTMDDFSLSVDNSGNMYFASNRLGGSGDDDIYFYQAPPEPEIVAQEEEESTEEPEFKVVNYFLEGKVLDRVTQEVIPNAEVSIYIFSGGIEEEFAKVSSKEDGTFGPIKMEEDAEYLLFTANPAFLSRRDNFTMYGRSIPQILLRKAETDTTFQIQIQLDKVEIGKTFKLENIYYDLDKYDIRADAAIELDKLVQILLDNPLIKIELGSHTDSRGTAVYNQRLAQRRAESAVAYIISRGINANRIIAQGYGEEELLIEDAKTEEEHQQNRRTEFKIIGINSTE